MIGSAMGQICKMVSGVRCQRRLWPRASSQIEKETNEHRMRQVQPRIMYSVHLIFRQDQLDQQDSVLLSKKDPVNPVILSKEM